MNEEFYAQINNNISMHKVNEMFDAWYFNEKITLVSMDVIIDMNT